jgi:hypothetical protein
MSLLPNDDDWGIFLDGDAMFTVHDWGHLIEDTINNNPVFDLFSCVTNRVGTKYQCIEGMWDVDDMASNWKLGKSLKTPLSYKNVIDITNETPISGVLIALRKKTWKSVGGFPTGAGMLGVDNEIHYRVRNNGMKVGLMQSVYVMHYYRNGRQEHKDHLS